MANPAQMTLWRRIRAFVGGIALTTVGVAGLVLPILPGWILIFAGLALLASVVPALRRLASRAAKSPLANRVIGSAARSDTGRRLITFAMRLPTLRSGLTPSARWQVVRTLLREDTDSQSAAESPR